ncbi:MAG: hypothetical protein AAFN11_05380, partial [Chloroflexota bacterium]
MNHDTSPAWNISTKRTITIIVFIFVVLALWFLRAVLPLVIISALIAFVLNPIVTLLTRRVFIARQNRGARRGLAAVITFIFAIFAVTILFLLIVPDLLAEVGAFGRQIPAFIQEFEDEIETVLDQPIIVNGEPFIFEGEEFNLLDRIEEITGSRDISALLNLDQ